MYKTNRKLEMTITHEGSRYTYSKGLSGETVTIEKDGEVIETTRFFIGADLSVFYDKAERHFCEMVGIDLEEY